MTRATTCVRFPRLSRWAVLATLTAALVASNEYAAAQPPDAHAALVLPNPILFVTQVPIRGDFTSIGSTFGNHLASLQSVGRGGDLWIRYTDGTLKNLTLAAGYGSASGFQGNNAIAVRDPSPHWSGTKAIFSMVVGGAAQRYEYETYYWQMYEITGLGAAETPVITKVPNQPANANNVSPIYGTDDKILFTTDRPRGGQAHLYPQRDEYERAYVVSGLWRLDPTNGALELLNHAPSGDFTPTIDSFGRVVFTQWDHLQRDQLADADENAGTGQNCDSGGDYGSIDFDSESSHGHVTTGVLSEVFPEPRSCRGDLLAGTNLVGHGFNHFFPWTIEENGTGGETLNHIGRHELHGYIPAAIDDDPNVEEFYGQYARFNPRRIDNLFQIEEDPTTPGRYYGVDAPEFYTHASGQIVSIDAPPSTDADHMAVTYVTHRDTAGSTATANHSGHYREPTPLTNGTVVVVHTDDTSTESGSGGPLASSYEFRLKTLTSGANGYQVAGTTLTSGITKQLSYWDPDNLVSFNGTLWELNPVELRVRTPPSRTPPALAAPEQAMLAAAGVTEQELTNYLVSHDLALAVIRSATTRDDFDLQQPFNLRVPGGGVQTIGKSGKIYDIAFLQIFQGDLVRGTTGTNASTTPQAGRRVLARALHDTWSQASNASHTGPVASVAVESDGSIAAFVPARRAMTWQLTDPAGVPVVRERYWVTFQPGEIRVCGSCHGASSLDQAGHTAPTNSPQALKSLLQKWKSGSVLFVGDFESGGTSTWSTSVGG